MTTYTAKFKGRAIGAIGAFSRFTVQVAADSIDGARLALYDTHEHISGLEITENKLNARLNKRERRAAQLLAHYATCERLALALGMPAAKVDGKKISVALFKIEREAHNAATAQCNGETYQGQPYRSTDAGGMDLAAEGGSPLSEWEFYGKCIAERVAMVFGRSPRPEHAPPGFFVNGDARGYALKIDNEQPAGAALIAAVRMHTDWGGYGILSPEIDGS